MSTRRFSKFNLLTPVRREKSPRINPETNRPTLFDEPVFNLVPEYAITGESLYLTAISYEHARAISLRIGQIFDTLPEVRCVGIYMGYCGGKRFRGCFDKTEYDRWVKEDKLTDWSNPKHT